MVVKEGSRLLYPASSIIIVPLDPQTANWGPRFGPLPALRGHVKLHFLASLKLQTAIQVVNNGGQDYSHRRRAGHFLSVQVFIS